MDIMAPSPISALATISAHSSVSGAPDVNRVETRPGAERANTDAHTANGQGQPDNAADYRAMKSRSGFGTDGNNANIDPYTQTGPTPSFQITLLEVEQDLKTILARIEANRAKDSNADAIRPADPAHVAAKASLAEGAQLSDINKTPAHLPDNKQNSEQKIQSQGLTSLPQTELSQTEVQPTTPQIALAEAAKPDVMPV